MKLFRLLFVVVLVVAAFCVGRYEGRGAVSIALFAEWKTPVDMEWDRLMESRMNPWFKFLHPPPLARLHLYSAAQELFGQLKDERGQSLYDENGWETVRFDLCPPLRRKGLERLSIGIPCYGRPEVRYITSETPWCDLCRKHGHLASAARCLTPGETREGIRRRELHIQQHPAQSVNAAKEVEAWILFKKKVNVAIGAEIIADESLGDVCGLADVRFLPPPRGRLRGGATDSGGVGVPTRPGRSSSRSHSDRDVPLHTSQREHVTGDRPPERREEKQPHLVSKEEGLPPPVEEEQERPSRDDEVLRHVGKDQGRRQEESLHRNEGSPERGPSKVHHEGCVGIVPEDVIMQEAPLVPIVEAIEEAAQDHRQAHVEQQIGDGEDGHHVGVGYVDGAAEKVDEQRLQDVGVLPSQQLIQTPPSTSCVMITSLPAAPVVGAPVFPTVSQGLSSIGQPRPSHLSVIHGTASFSISRVNIEARHSVTFQGSAGGRWLLEGAGPSSRVSTGGWLVEELVPNSLSRPPVQVRSVSQDCPPPPVRDKDVCTSMAMAAVVPMQGGPCAGRRLQEEFGEGPTDRKRSRSRKRRRKGRSQARAGVRERGKQPMVRGSTSEEDEPPRKFREVNHVGILRIPGVGEGRPAAGRRGIVGRMSQDRSSQPGGRIFGKVEALGSVPGEYALMSATVRCQCAMGVVIFGKSVVKDLVMQHWELWLATRPERTPFLEHLHQGVQVLAANMKRRAKVSGQVHGRTGQEYLRRMEALGEASPTGSEDEWWAEWVQLHSEWADWQVRDEELWGLSSKTKCVRDAERMSKAFFAQMKKSSHSPLIVSMGHPFDPLEPRAESTPDILKYVELFYGDLYREDEIWSTENMASLPMNDVWSEKAPPANFGQATIILLYKKGSVEEVRNWRPISLLSAPYKVYAKVLANRIALVLPSLIHPTQMGFVVRRQILVNVLLVRQIMEKARCSQPSLATLFLDFEKAYDRVRWPFLLQGMRCRGVGEGFVRAVEVVLGMAEVRVQINGLLYSPLRITRSVRQGCPLSPTLYILYVEHLHEMIRANEQILGFELPGGTQVKSNAFADDTAAMSRPSHDDVSALRSEVSLFEKYAGAWANWGKFVAVVLDGVDITMFQGMRTQSTEEQFLYLDIQIPVALSLGYQLDDLLHRAVTRMSAWAKRASHGVFGKVLIANNAVSATLWYAGTVSDPPKRAWKGYKGALRKFLWKDDPCTSHLI
ncbi:hypothetical protein CBR_g41331 [Chara braunii]|uniref:Reverse transcriptase domain-containing protein n=1 Tax=Chara braunii TaxID=69332 RepID=A0A388LVJ2_CHABU|nr:hypothetical protein CBR_g41331 [Chara braunii]|eukprot:GBG86336.1 hypothetical protein CBR_g41331 [Chara braunii]